MCVCHCEPMFDESAVEKSSGRPRFGLFNKITGVLVVSWVLIVGSVVESVHSDQPAVTTPAFVDLLLR